VKEVAVFHLLIALMVSSILPVQPSSCRIPSMLQDLMVQTYIGITLICPIQGRCRCLIVRHLFKRASMRTNCCSEACRARVNYINKSIQHQDLYITLKHEKTIKKFCATNHFLMLRPPLTEQEPFPLQQAETHNICSLHSVCQIET